MIGVTAAVKPKRALSIVNSTTKEFLNDQKSTSKPHIGASASTAVVSPRNFGDTMSARPITVDPIKSATNKRSHQKNGGSMHNITSSLSTRGHDQNAPQCVLKAAEKDGMMIDLI